MSVILTHRRLHLPAVFRYIFLILLAVFVSLDASARWKKIYTNPVGHNFRAVCFRDEQFGIIGADGSDGVFVTHDGGQSWSRVMLPGAGPSNVGQILLLDNLNGYLTLDAGDNNMPILYRTSTGGMSWTPINLPGSAPDVYITPSAMIVTNRRDSTDAAGKRIPIGRTYFSYDNGNTFVPGAVMMGNAVDFVDDVHGVMVTYRGHVWSRTIDGGISWSTLNSADTEECWGIYAVKGSSTFFTAGEKDQSNRGLNPLPSEVRRSDDYGATWRYVSTLPFRTTGHIAGVGQTLYVQSDNTISAGSGLYRSKDGGLNWQSISGPTNEEDTRFQVLGCRGEVIIAFDLTGGVWMTDDGGDGSLPQYTISETDIALDTITACLPTDTTLTISNVGCDTVFIASARSLQQYPSLEFLNDDGTALALPVIILPGYTGTVRIRVVHTNAGPITARAEIETRRRGTTHEDTVSITGNVGFYDPMQAMARLQFDSVSICDIGDSIVTLTNPGCRAIHLLSARLWKGTSFLLTGVALDSIASGGTKSFGIRFAPSGLGDLMDSLIVTYEVFGVQRRVSVPIGGIGKPDNAAFVLAVDQLPPGLPTELEFGTMTRCDIPDTLSFTITNPGCTVMMVAPVQVQDSNHRQILLPTKQIWWQTMAIPSSVKTGDTLRLKVRIAPTALGEVRGYVRLTYTLAGATPKDYFLPYHATVIRGPVILDLPDGERSFDSIQFCAQKDIVVPIHNAGCDTMVITQRSLASGDFFIVNPKAVPLSLAPGATDNVTLRYIPNRSGDASGTLSIVTDADSVNARTIPLTGYAIPTDTISFTAYTPNQIVYSGDTAVVRFISNKTIYNKGVNSITATLAYDGDIMTPWPATASSDIPGVRVLVPAEVRGSGKMTRQTLNIIGANIPLDSGVTIASLLFHITLSDSSRTDFHVESITLNNGTGSFEKCVLGSVIDSGSIDLAFQCGDALLNGYMIKQKEFRLSDAIRLKSKTVIPDPVSASSTAVLPLEVLKPGTFAIHIFNAAGKEVAHQRLILNAGAASIDLNATTLPSGANHLVIEDESGRILTADFVVRK